MENKRNMEDKNKMAKHPTISLKLHIDTQGNRVLFAEVKKDFVDFLSHLLSLPLATANRLLREQGMLGSISNLYSSVQRLDLCYMQQETKDTILNPRLFHPNKSFSYEPQFFPKNLFSLNELHKCQHCNHISTDKLSGCPNHALNSMIPLFSCDPNLLTPFFTASVRRRMSTPSYYNSASAGPNKSESSEGGFVKGVVSYIVMDNLELRPMSGISVIKNLLDELDMKIFGLLQERVVNMGMDEAMKLLKSSLHSQTVLTDVFLKKRTRPA